VEELNRQFSCEHGVPADTRCDSGCDSAPWRCLWVLPVRSSRAGCVYPYLHGDDDEHIAVVDDQAVLFGSDVGEKWEGGS
jgi:hypothetical protein